MRSLDREADGFKRTSESGVAMMMALAVVLILSLITVALVNLAVAEYSTATTLDASTQAFLAAEAGAERGVADLRADGDWSNNVPTAPWTPLYTEEAFPNSGSGVSQVGTFSVSVQHTPGYDASTNIVIRSLGRVRGATRTIQFTLHRITPVDFAVYTIGTVDITSIPGGGSLNFHGSAYFRGDLILRGSSGAGIYNDRLLFSADAPNYLNHLFVRGDLDLRQGNPVIGSPYWWVHVRGSITGSSSNFDPVNLDSVVPAVPYPNVVEAVRNALLAPGNLLAPVGNEMRHVVCRWNGAGWVPSPQTDLNLTGSSAADTFFLPRAGESCTGYPNSISQVRAGNNYMLMWDPQDSGAQLVFANPDLPIYIPGKVLLGRDVRYQGKGTVIVANAPTFVDPGSPGNLLFPQAMNTCAWDLNGTGSCDGGPSTGRTLKARISPCQGSPGTDNPNTTFPTQDLVGFVVNGQAYSDVNATACDQEMDFAALVGDETSTACWTSQRKLQVYGFLVSRCLGLGQVPDFWQMPDMLTNLPQFFRSLFRDTRSPVQPRSWQELF